MIPRRNIILDGLTSMLESLPSYENLTENSDESALFDEEQEPPSGLINLIRRNSYSEETSITSPNTVRRISKLFRNSYYLYR